MNKQNFNRFPFISVDDKIFCDTFEPNDWHITTKMSRSMLLTLIYVLKDEIRKKMFKKSRVCKEFDDHDWKDVKEVLKAITRKMAKTLQNIEVPGFEKMVVEDRQLYQI